MKKYFIGATSAAVSLITLATLAFGQISLPVMASIPFAFTVQSKQLPAGRYSVREVAGNPNVLLIRSEDSSEKPVAVLTNTAGSLNPQDQGKLLFDKIGNRYFLTGVWPGGQGFGREIIETESERHSERSGDSVAGGNIEHTAVPCSTK